MRLSNTKLKLINKQRIIAPSTGEATDHANSKQGKIKFFFDGRGKQEYQETQPSQCREENQNSKAMNTHDRESGNRAWDT